MMYLVVHTIEGFRVGDYPLIYSFDSLADLLPLPPSDSTHTNCMHHYPSLQVGLYLAKRPTLHLLG